MIRFTGNIPQCMQQSRWTVPQILNDWSKYNMKMKELFDRGEFVVSAEVTAYFPDYRYNPLS